MTDSIKPESFNIKDTYAPPILKEDKIISAGDAKTRVIWSDNNTTGQFNFAAVKNRNELGALDFKSNWIDVTIDGQSLVGNINSISKRFGISKKEIRQMNPDQLGTLLKAAALPPAVNTNRLSSEEKPILKSVATELLGTKAIQGENLEKNIEFYLTNLSSSSPIYPEAHNFFSQLYGPKYKDILSKKFFEEVKSKAERRQIENDLLNLLNAIPMLQNKTEYTEGAKQRARKALNKESDTVPQTIVNLFLYEMLKENGIPQPPLPQFASLAEKMGILRLSAHEEIKNQVSRLPSTRKKTDTFYRLVAQEHDRRVKDRGENKIAGQDRERILKAIRPNFKESSLRTAISSARFIEGKPENEAPSESLVNIFLYNSLPDFSHSPIDPPEFYNLGKELGILGKKLGAR